MAESPIFGEPPHGSEVCPRCGRIFEVAFSLSGAKAAGHQPGHPRTCEPLPGAMPYGDRDARKRKASRRGR